ncbi:DUF5333 domain-containing protein [Actibacterium sp. D379-3]
MTQLTKQILAAMAALAIPAASGAVAANSLREHKQINDGLAVIAAADMIRKNCETVDPRMIRAYGFMQSLKGTANAAGFSDDEIEAFVEDKAEKARVEAAARAYLATLGADPATPQSYCAAGLYEIERNSQIGVLLKAK